MKWLWVMFVFLQQACAQPSLPPMPDRASSADKPTPSEPEKVEPAAGAKDAEQRESQESEESDGEEDKPARDDSEDSVEDEADESKPNLDSAGDSQAAADDALCARTYRISLEQLVTLCKSFAAQAFPLSSSEVEANRRDIDPLLARRAYKSVLTPSEGRLNAMNFSGSGQPLGPLRNASLNDVLTGALICAATNGGSRSFSAIFIQGQSEIPPRCLSFTP